MPKIDYKQAIAAPPSTDLANREIQGMLVSRTVRLMMFTLNKNAVWASDYRLRMSSYPFASISFPALRKAFRLQPGDVFKLTWPPLDISEWIVRVMKIEEANAEDETITVHCQEEPTNLAYLLDSYDNVPDYSTKPDPVALDKIDNFTVIEAPYVFVEDEKIRLIILAGRENKLSTGFFVYASSDGGVTYTKIEQQANYAVHGELTTTYPYTTQIDDITSFNVEFTNATEVSEITSTARTDLFGLTNLALLGGEWITFQDITLVSGSIYTISGVYRHRFDTEPVDHAIGTDFYWCPSFDMLQNVEFVNGVTRHFKIVPYTEKASGDIDDATAFPYTIYGRAFTPYMPINLEANGEGIRPAYSTDVDLTWDTRIRDEGAGMAIPTGATDASPTWEGLFEVEVWVGGALVRTKTDINDDEWTYSEAMNLSDNGSLASTILFKLSNFIDTDGARYQSDKREITVTKE
jgi:hypothetical protein